MTKINVPKSNYNIYFYIICIKDRLYVVKIYHKIITTQLQNYNLVETNSVETNFDQILNNFNKILDEFDVNKFDKILDEFGIDPILPDFELPTDFN